MALSSNEIISRCGTTLNDVTGVRWTIAELLTYITDAMRRVCGAIPSAYALTGSMTLQVTGGYGCKQPLPTTATATFLQTSPTATSATRIIDVIRNLTASGGPSAAIRPIERAVLDANDLYWHTRTGPLVQHYYYDSDHDNSIWWIYPGPAAAGQIVEMTVACDPPAITTASNAPLVIDPLYHEAIIDYVIARAVMKDAEEVGNNNLQRAQIHAQSFYTAIGQDYKGAPASAA